MYYLYKHLKVNKGVLKSFFEIITVHITLNFKFLELRFNIIKRK